MKKTRGEKIFGVFNYFFLTLMGFIMLFPFYVTLIQSVAPAVDFGTKLIILWPSKFDFGAYVALIGQGSGLVDAYSVTVFITVVGTVSSMFFSTLGAVALANKKLPYRTGLTLFMLGTMYFGGGMIPSYLLNRYLGLLNTLWVLIIPALVSTGTILMLRNFIMALPHEILESATIDGCSDIGLVPRIILPLSMAAIATFSLFHAVGFWNTFMAGAIYITDPKKQPLQVYLKEILNDSSAMRLDPEEMKKMFEHGGRPPLAASLKAANIMAATIPIVCVYPFLQKYFVKGLIVGSLKG